MGKKSEAKFIAVKQHINSLTTDLDLLFFTLDKLKRVLADWDNKKRELARRPKDVSLSESIAELEREFSRAKGKLQALVPRASKSMLDANTDLLDYGAFLSHKAQKYASPIYTLMRKSLEEHQKNYVDLVPKLDNLQQRFDTFTRWVSPGLL